MDVTPGAGKPVSDAYFVREKKGEFVSEKKTLWTRFWRHLAIGVKGRGLYDERDVERLAGRVRSLAKKIGTEAEIDAVIKFKSLKDCISKMNSPGIWDKLQRAIERQEVQQNPTYMQTNLHGWDSSLKRLESARVEYLKSELKQYSYGPVDLTAQSRASYLVELAKAGVSGEELKKDGEISSNTLNEMETNEFEVLKDAYNTALQDELKQAGDDGVKRSGVLKKWAEWMVGAHPRIGATFIALADLEKEDKTKFQKYEALAVVQKCRGGNTHRSEPEKGHIFPFLGDALQYWSDLPGVQEECTRQINAFLWNKAVNYRPGVSENTPEEELKKALPRDFTDNQGVVLRCIRETKCLLQYNTPLSVPPFSAATESKLPAVAITENETWSLVESRVSYLKRSSQVFQEGDALHVLDDVKDILENKSARAADCMKALGMVKSIISPYNNQNIPKDVESKALEVLKKAADVLSKDANTDARTKYVTLRNFLADANTWAPSISSGLSTALSDLITKLSEEALQAIASSLEGPSVGKDAGELAEQMVAHVLSGYSNEIPDTIARLAGSILTKLAIKAAEVPNTSDSNKALEFNRLYSLIGKWKLPKANEIRQGFVNSFVGKHDSVLKQWLQDKTSILARSGDLLSDTQVDEILSVAQKLVQNPKISNDLAHQCANLLSALITFGATDDEGRAKLLERCSSEVCYPVTEKTRLVLKYVHDNLQEKFGGAFQKWVQNNVDRVQQQFLAPTSEFAKFSVLLRQSVLFSPSPIVEREDRARSSAQASEDELQAIDRSLEDPSVGKDTCEFAEQMVSLVLSKYSWEIPYKTTRTVDGVMWSTGHPKEIPDAIVRLAGSILAKLAIKAAKAPNTSDANRAQEFNRLYNLSGEWKFPKAKEVQQELVNSFVGKHDSVLKQWLQDKTSMLERTGGAPSKGQVDEILSVAQKLVQNPKISNDLAHQCANLLSALITFGATDDEGRAELLERCSSEVCYPATERTDLVLHAVHNNLQQKFGGAFQKWVQNNVDRMSRELSQPTDLQRFSSLLAQSLRFSPPPDQTTESHVAILKQNFGLFFEKKAVDVTYSLPVFSTKASVPINYSEEDKEEIEEWLKSFPSHELADVLGRQAPIKIGDKEVSYDMTKLTKPVVAGKYFLKIVDECVRRYPSMTRDQIKKMVTEVLLRTTSSAQIPGCFAPWASAIGLPIADRSFVFHHKSLVFSFGTETPPILRFIQESVCALIDVTGGNEKKSSCYEQRIFSSPGDPAYDVGREDHLCRFCSSSSKTFLSSIFYEVITFSLHNYRLGRSFYSHVG